MIATKILLYLPRYGASCTVISDVDFKLFLATTVDPLWESYIIKEVQGVYDGSHTVATIVERVSEDSNDLNNAKYIAQEYKKACRNNVLLTVENLSVCEFI